MSSSAPHLDDTSGALSPPTAATTPPAEDCTSQLNGSARALAAADRRSQCLEGIVERLVRPMLATCTLTEELQAVVCLGPSADIDSATCAGAWSDAAHRSLSVYARKTADVRDYDCLSRDEYVQYSGLDWQTTTADSATQPPRACRTRWPCGWSSTRSCSGWMIICTSQ